MKETTRPGFDMARLRRAFGRAAEGYLAAAALQKEVESRLLEQLDYLKQKQPQRILDLGSGPGRASASMKQRWTSAEVIAFDIAFPMLQQVHRQTPFWRPVRRVCGDARQLPFADGSFDLVFSSLCLQWVPDLPRALSELRRVLRADGLLVFSTFGPDTLVELYRAYIESGEMQPPISSFAAIQQVGDALMAAGFHNPVLDRETFTLTYPDLRALMRDLRAIGANDARVDRPRGLRGKARLQGVTAAYETLRRDGLLPSSWEVITALAWSPGAGAPRREGGLDIAAFPADLIPVRRR